MDLGASGPPIFWSVGDWPFHINFSRTSCPSCNLPCILVLANSPPGNSWNTSTFKEKSKGVRVQVWKTCMAVCTCHRQGDTRKPLAVLRHPCRPEDIHGLQVIGGCRAHTSTSSLRTWWRSAPANRSCWSRLLLHIHAHNHSHTPKHSQARSSKGGRNWNLERRSADSRGRLDMRILAVNVTNWDLAKVCMRAGPEHPPQRYALSVLVRWHGRLARLVNVSLGSNRGVCRLLPVRAHLSCNSLPLLDSGLGVHNVASRWPRQGR